MNTKFRKSLLAYIRAARALNIGLPTPVLDHLKSNGNSSALKRPVFDETVHIEPHRELDAQCARLLGYWAKSIQPGIAPTFAGLKRAVPEINTMALRRAVAQSEVKHGAAVVEESWDMMHAALLPSWKEDASVTENAAEWTALVASGELFNTIRQLGSSIILRVPNDPYILYAAALMAEYTYYQILPEELDIARKRARIFVPSQAFEELIASGMSLLLPQGTFGEMRVFTVYTKNVLATAINVGNCTFIGFRGTIRAYANDRRTNLSIKLVHLEGCPRVGGKYHSGFAEEALRILNLVEAQLVKLGLGASQLILSGHSLGGAIAAVAQCILVGRGAKLVPTITFGAPRFCDKEAIAARNSIEHAPVQIRRHGDFAPFVPGRVFGYADPVVQYAPNGMPLKSRASTACELMRSAFSMAATAAGAHSMERYRTDIEPIVGLSLSSRLGLGGFEITPGELT